MPFTIHLKSVKIANLKRLELKGLLTKNTTGFSSGEKSIEFIKKIKYIFINFFFLLITTFKQFINLVFITETIALKLWQQFLFISFVEKFKPAFPFPFPTATKQLMDLFLPSLAVMVNTLFIYKERKKKSRHGTTCIM